MDILCLNICYFSCLPYLFWAEDQIWDLHQPSSGQNPCRDGWLGEDWSQCTGRSHHRGPRVPPPQDAVIPVHQSGSQRAQREDRCSEELRGHPRTTALLPSRFRALCNSRSFGHIVPIMIPNDHLQKTRCASLLLRQYVRWKPAYELKESPCKISWTYMIAHSNDHSYDYYLWHLSVLC